MKEETIDGQPKFRLSILFWVALALFCVGSGPLLLTILLAKLGVTADPNPNPILFGIMAMFSFWPSVGLVIGGLAASYFRYRWGEMG